MKIKRKFKTQTRNILILLLADLIWGNAYVAQSTGGDALGSFSFNCIRSLVAFAALFIVVKIMDRAGISKKPASPSEKKTLIIAGIACGTALFFAGNLQQLGINGTDSTGKAGFLTATYILMVPIAGLFFKKRCGLNVWFGVILALVGMYLLCVTDSFSLGKADIYLIGCAVAFTVQILCISHFSPKVDSVRLACLEFLVSGLLTVPPAIITDMGGTFAGFLNRLPLLADPGALFAIFFAGVMSGAVGYTFQVIGQKGLDPTLASLVMSLESVVSALAGWALLHQQLTIKETLGCAFIFIAIIAAQIEPKKNNTNFV